MFLFSTRLTNVAHNKLSLAEEVDDLKENAKKHFNEVYQAKKAKCITESKLNDTMRAIETDQKNFQDERARWKKEKVDLLLVRDSARTTKNDAEVKLKLSLIYIMMFQVLMYIIVWRQRRHIVGVFVKWGHLMDAFEVPCWDLPCSHEVTKP